MAHQTDVHRVGQTFTSENAGEKVTDPVCGMEIERRASRHMAFRSGDAFYFCSRECKDRFLDPAFSRTRKQAA
jgi:YHS domain-containing protein